MTTTTASATGPASVSYILPTWVLSPEAALAKEPTEHLRDLLQVALQVEFSTIPPYLTAMYSIRDKTSWAYQLIRSVAMEEMLHLNLVSNMLNAVGGTPTLVLNEGNMVFPPRYPAHLSDQAEGGGAYLQLMAASPQMIRETFMKIEQPAQPDAPPQATEFSTIGQLYQAIKILFETYEGPYDTANQSCDWNFGNNGGTVIEVADRTTAIQAINEIVEQGEGADLTQDIDTSRYQKTQPWGQYEYYGPRSDGTYGPILGTPLELSHYFKFKAIADGTTPLPATYPMAANPTVENFVNPLAKELGELFNFFYSLLVDELQEALRGNREKFFTSVVPLMRVALPVLATQLMQTPFHDRAYTSVDPTAGPPFRYVAEQQSRSSQKRAQSLAQRAGDLADTVLDGAYPSASTTLVAALRKIERNV